MRDARVCVKKIITHKRNSDLTTTRHHQTTFYRFRTESPFGPENCHNWVSSLKTWTTPRRFGATSLKIAFLCLQTTYTPRIISELNPFRCCFFTSLPKFISPISKRIRCLTRRQWDRCRGYKMLNQNQHKTMLVSYYNKCSFDSIF